MQVTCRFCFMLEAKISSKHINICTYLGIINFILELSVRMQCLLGGEGSLI